MGFFPGPNNLELVLASGDALDVRRFQVKERVSTLFEVKLVVLGANPDLDLEAIVGSPARFVARGGAESAHVRSWSGVCIRLEQVRAEETGLSTYELEIAPTLWLLTQRRNHRIFQRMTELEIVKKLLGEWGIEPLVRVADPGRKREIRVQHAESDYRFMCRMLEDAGITFFFELEDGETRLVLTDAPHAADPRPSISFRDAPTVADREHVTALRASRRLRPGKYTVRDRDYRRPASFKLLGTASGGAEIEQQLERVHYVEGAFVYEGKGGGTPVADDKGVYRADEGEAAALAKRRLDAKRATANEVSFSTNTIDMAPGVVVSILDHPKKEVGSDKPLLVVGATFSGKNDGDWNYDIEAVSASVPFAPELSTPKPKVTGLESATVVGPAGEEIHVDELGRVRVHFHWDAESGMNDESSCWIPVCHPWAGTGFGMVNIPRIGQEVIVDFLGGDPDRPVVVGRVYTSTQKVPYSLPGNKTQSGWKSNSTGGGGGYNEIMFEDAGGQELFRVQAEKDLAKLVKHDETVTIGHDRTKFVGNDDSLTVGNDRTHLVGNNESISIGVNQTIRVGVNQSTSVGVNQSLKVGKNQSVEIGKNQTIHIGKNQSLTVDGDQSITLPHGDQTESIKGDRRFSLTGDLYEKITGDSFLNQEGDQSETHTGDRTVMRTGDRDETWKGDVSTVQLGDRTDVMAGDTTSLHLGDRTDIRIGAEKHFQLGNQVEMQLGGRTDVQIGALDVTRIGAQKLDQTGDNTETIAGNKTVAATATTTVKGGMINVEAGGITTIKGAIIKLNC